ncbi:MAG: hypothetical protein AAF429_00860 [Pseudomonadota bacterium]
MSHDRFDYFVIIGLMRTGSNLLERSLAQFEDIMCFGEVYNPEFVGFLESEKGLDLTVLERDKDPVAALSRVKNIDRKIGGLRLFPDHDLAVLHHCINDARCAKIVLKRNPLDSFVSEKLAQKTNQWRMGDLHTKIDGKVDFDPKDFEAYLKDTRAFYAQVNMQLQLAGETAMQVDYDDLQSVEVVNGIAKFIGSTKTIKNFKFRSSKQNSGALSEKIENFDELANYRNPILALDRAQFDYFEPEVTPSTKSLRLGVNIELAYLPTRYFGTDPIIDWMTTLDPKQVPPLKGLSKNEVRDWSKAANLKFCFADLEHPLDRAYNAFCDLFLFPAERYGGIRATLIKRYGLELVPASYSGEKTRNGLEAEGYTAKKHYANFKKFLKFLGASLRDQALYQPKPEFSSQTEQLASYSAWAIPQFIALPHTRESVLKSLLDTLGLAEAPLPTAGIKDQIFDLEDIYDLKIETLIRDAYARDYLNFGFMDYAISPK